MAAGVGASKPIQGRPANIAIWQSDKFPAIRLCWIPNEKSTGEYPVKKGSK